MLSTTQKFLEEITSIILYWARMLAKLSFSLIGNQRAFVKKTNLHHNNQRSRQTLKTRSFFGKLFGNKEMGSSSSKQQKETFQPDQPSTPNSRKQSKSGFDITPLTPDEREKYAASLTDFQKYVTLKAGTERAFTGKTVDGTPHDSKRKGVYVSAIGGLPLFSSNTKFNSGTGWPSFFAPIDPEHIIEVRDTSIPFMPRVEVIDARSGAHLGHVFNDGPRPTGKRYCINAAALKFIPEDEPIPDESKPMST